MDPEGWESVEAGLPNEKPPKGEAAGAAAPEDELAPKPPKAGVADEVPNEKPPEEPAAGGAGAGAA